ncbi:MAG: BrnA antitoxin family protein [Rhodospirillales bacterium]
MRVSAEEAARLPIETDRERADQVTGTALEASIAADPDEAGLEFDWANATLEIPQPKAVLNMRVDKPVLDYFRATGRGYQTRINAVLASYVKQKAGG